MAHPRLGTAALAGAVLVLAAGAGVAGYAETHAIRTHHVVAKAASPALPAQAAGALRAPPAGASAPATGPQATPAGVAAALRAPLRSAALGPNPLVDVADLSTGRVLLSRGAGEAGAPASTAKLLTAAAVLAEYPATHRFTTRVVAGGDGTVVLVGGGDPTLTAAAKGRPNLYPGAARISSLAAQLSAAHVTVRRIVVDDALFTGPSVSPHWDAEDVPSSYGAPITALMVDGGRPSPEAVVRSDDPDLVAGHALAAALHHPDLAVTRGSAPAGAMTLASVASAPLGQIVEQTLQQSDDVLADVLARQVALATGRPASFAGAVAAIRSVLAGLGVRVGTGMVDGSGLAASDRLSPATLIAVLRLVAGAAHPGLRDVLSGLPVAGWSGTLADRFVPGTPGSAAAGLVRAKTGTLTGVSTLAGVVHDKSGHLLAFAILADHAPATGPAEAALDRAASALAGCGCA